MAGHNDDWFIYFAMLLQRQTMRNFYICCCADTINRGLNRYTIQKQLRHYKTVLNGVISIFFTISTLKASYKKISTWYGNSLSMIFLTHHKTHQSFDTSSKQTFTLPLIKKFQGIFCSYSTPTKLTGLVLQIVHVLQ